MGKNYKINWIINFTKNIKYPNRIALIDDENKKYTYQELRNRIDAISHLLIKKNIKINDRVAICGSNSYEFVCCYFAIAKIGAVSVLINPELPKKQIEFILKDSESVFLITDKFTESTINLIRFHELPHVTEKKIDIIHRDENDPATILYTSGSTGRSKGVIQANRTHNWTVETRSNYSNHDGIVIIAAPCTHMNGLINLETTLCIGGTVILLKKFQEKTFAEAIEKYKVTFISALPSMLAMLFKNPKICENKNFSYVMHVWTSSSKMNQSIVEKIKIYFPNALITNGYGSTESTGLTFWKNNEIDDDICHGYLYNHTELKARIINGILEIKSPAQALGYTQDRFPRTEDGYYITNDKFFIDENECYWYLGRADDTIICGGHKIIPHDIEKILESHKLIKTAIVIGIEDNIKGEKPYAFVTVNNHITENELIKHVNSFLPYSHCPRNVWIIDNFPVDRIGKIDKKKLKEIAKDLLK